MTQKKSGVLQKRIPKGHTGGGRWTKNNVPDVNARSTAAFYAQHRLRELTAARIRLYKIRKKMDKAEPGSSEMLRLQQAMDAINARYQALRVHAIDAVKAAQKEGYKFGSGGAVIKHPKFRGDNLQVKRYDVSSMTPEEIGRAVEGSVVYDKVRSVIEKSGKWSWDGDSVGDVLHEIGYTDKPNLVSSPGGYDDNIHITRIVYRGVPKNITGGDLYEEQLKRGEMFVGGGIMGHGIYAVTSKDVARKYTNGYNNGVIEIYEPAHFHIGNFEEFSRLADKVVYSTNNSTTDVFKESPAMVALALGYDGLKMDIGDTDEYVLYFNRRDLYVGDY